MLIGILTTLQTTPLSGITKIIKTGRSGYGSRLLQDTGTIRGWLDTIFLTKVQTLNT